MIKLGITGSCGKMGRRIYELAGLDKDLEVALVLEKKRHAFNRQGSWQNKSFIQFRRIIPGGCFGGFYLSGSSGYAPGLCR
ncbi:MAG: hypothetical protein Q8O02_03240 [Candidatus Omnitrophota bacterium]|nr:hypothetical protein [Candidatus Omnitrophota bacterium]